MPFNVYYFRLHNLTFFRNTAFIYRSRMTSIPRTVITLCESVCEDLTILTSVLNTPSDTNFVMFCKTTRFLPKHTVNISWLIVLFYKVVKFHNTLIINIWLVSILYCLSTWKDDKRTLWIDIFIHLPLSTNLPHLEYSPCWKFRKVHSQGPKTLWA